MTMHTLVSHPLCPYVQRAAIVAFEKGITFARIDIDLSAKPEWFLAISPTGKTPLLMVEDDAGSRHVLFESAAIAEYCDEIAPGRLLPDDPLERARHRAWVEFASGTLAEIAALYNAPDAASYAAKIEILQQRMAQVDAAIEGTFFGGAQFGLVDAAFAPVFRYFDAFETLLDLDLVRELARVREWRQVLARRRSVKSAVSADYPDRLVAFLKARPGYVGLLSPSS